MAEGTLQILGLGTSAAPLEYQFSGNQTVDLIAVKADFDGTGAAGDFVPVVEILSNANHVMAQSIGDTVTAGDSATVTFGTFLGGTGSGNTHGFIHYGNNQNTGSDPGFLSVQVQDPTQSDAVAFFVSGTTPGDITLELDTTGGGEITLQNNSIGGSGINIENNGSLLGTGRTGVFIINNTAPDPGVFGIVIENNAGGDMTIDNNAGGLTSFINGVYQLEAFGITLLLDGGTQLNVTGLPVVNPGGTGNVWNDAGTLKIT